MNALKPVTEQSSFRIELEPENILRLVCLEPESGAPATVGPRRQIAEQTHTLQKDMVRRVRLGGQIQEHDRGAVRPPLAEAVPKTNEASAALTSEFTQSEELCNTSETSRTSTSWARAHPAAMRPQKRRSRQRFANFILAPRNHTGRTLPSRESEGNEVSSPHPPNRRRKNPPRRSPCAGWAGTTLSLSRKIQLRMRCSLAVCSSGLAAEKAQGLASPPGAGCASR